MGSPKPQTRAVFELSLGLCRYTGGSRLQDQGWPGMNAGENQHTQVAGMAGMEGASADKTGGAAGQVRPGGEEV